MFHLIDRLDVVIFHLLNGFAGNFLLDHLISYEESTNLLKGGLFLTVYSYFWFSEKPDGNNRRPRIIAIVVGTLVALVIARALANFAPFRLRPIFDIGLTHRPYAFTTSRNLEEWSSFPSDTATYFAALAYGLGHLSRRRLAVPIGLYTLVWICLPQMYLGLHYASDVVVGAEIGIVIVSIAVRIEWLQVAFAPRLLKWARTRPELFYSAAFLVAFEMAELFDTIRITVRSSFRTLYSRPHWEPLIFAETSTILGLIVVAGLIWFLYRTRNFGRQTPKEMRSRAG